MAKPKKRSTLPLRQRAKRGRKPWQPTDDERLMVQACKAAGFTHEQIAAALQVDCDTLVKHCSHELEAGKLVIDAKIGSKFVQKCLEGDTACLIFYHKTQRGWKEVDRRELTGPDGGPIATANANFEITPTMDAQQAAEAYQKLLG